MSWIKRRQLNIKAFKPLWGDVSLADLQFDWFGLSTYFYNKQK